MANTDLKTALLIALQTTGEDRVFKLRQSLLDLGLSADKAEELAGGLDTELKQIADSADKAGEKAGKSSVSISDLANQLAGLATAGAVMKFARDSVEAFGRAEASFRGLESQAKHSGVAIGEAMDVANRLAADGLVSVADASKALQNLLSRGYSIEQAEATLKRLTDAAAFNRQANLSMSEAVLSATEGLKNENSVLVDNAGVTRNVAKMWEDYAKAHNITTQEMTQAQKIQAEYNGIMKETEAQVGNAAKAMEGYQGQAAKAEQATNNFKVQLGQILAPTAGGLAEGGVWLIENFFKPVVFHAQRGGVELGLFVTQIDTIFEAIKNADFTDLGKKLDANIELAQESLLEYAKRLDGNTLAIAEQAREVEKLGKAGKQAGKEMAEGANQAGNGAKDAGKDFNQLREEIQAAARAASAENGLSQTSTRLAIEQAKTLYELAKAKGDTAGVTAAKNKISELEIELSRLQAQAAIAEARATVELAQEKYKEALQRGKNVKAAEDELTAAGYNYAAKEVQSQITEELANRTKQLATETDKLSASTGGASGAIGDLGGSMASTGSATQDLTRDIEALTAAEERLAAVRDQKNASRNAPTSVNWAYALGAQGIKLSPEEMSTFKSIIEDTYEQIRGTYSGEVVYSYQQLMDQAIKEAVEFARRKATTVSGGGAAPGSAPTQQSGRSAGAGITINLNGPIIGGNKDQLARDLQPAFERLNRLIR